MRHDRRQVRNAALHATLLALDDDGGGARAATRTRPVAAEYGKAGTISPLEPGGGGEPAGGVQAFLEALS